MNDYFDVRSREEAQELRVCGLRMPFARRRKAVSQVLALSFALFLQIEQTRQTRVYSSEGNFVYTTQPSSDQPLFQAHDFGYSDGRRQFESSHLETGVGRVNSYVERTRILLGCDEGEYGGLIAFIERVT